MKAPVSRITWHESPMELGSPEPSCSSRSSSAYEEMVVNKALPSSGSCRIDWLTVNGAADRATEKKVELAPWGDDSRGCASTPRVGGVRCVRYFDVQV